MGQFPGKVKQYTLSATPKLLLSPKEETLADIPNDPIAVNTVCKLETDDYFDELMSEVEVKFSNEVSSVNGNVTNVANSEDPSQLLSKLIESDSTCENCSKVNIPFFRSFIIFLYFIPFKTKT